MTANIHVSSSTLILLLLKFVPHSVAGEKLVQTIRQRSDYVNAVTLIYKYVKFTYIFVYLHSKFYYISSINILDILIR